MGMGLSTKSKSSGSCESDRIDQSIFGKIMKIEIYVADVTLFYENLKIVPALISGELQTICYLC